MASWTSPYRLTPNTSPNLWRGGQRGEVRFRRFIAFSCRIDNEEKVYAVFDGIPGQLSKKEKKYRFSSIGKNARFRSYEDSFIWLNESMVVNEGMMMENIVAQMLRRNGRRLYFYSRSDSANRENHLEIDFLITENHEDRPDRGKICQLPIPFLAG